MMWVGLREGHDHWWTKFAVKEVL